MLYCEAGILHHSIIVIIVMMVFVVLGLMMFLLLFGLLVFVLMTVVIEVITPFVIYAGMGVDSPARRQYYGQQQAQRQKKPV